MYFRNPPTLQVSWPSGSRHTPLRLQPGAPDLRFAARRDRGGHRTGIRRFRRLAKRRDGGFVLPCLPRLTTKNLG